jgi:pimeloyl-ACP methyl ester carboxylesterase
MMRVNGKIGSGPAMDRVKVILAGMMCLVTWARGEVREFALPTPSAMNPTLTWHYRLPEGTGSVTGVLLLVPGYNGSGKAMLDARWCRFADGERLALLAPTFLASEEEQAAERGYYYPWVWSGAATEAALDELKRRHGVPVERVLIFGFSAGAHFGHRFALWKPERVRTFVAYSAAWWSAPTEALRGTSGLVMCGETDGRHDASLAFFRAGRALGLPLAWRSWPRTGHTLTPAVRGLSEAWLRHYARGWPEEAWAGDVQSQRIVPGAEADTIPAEVRTWLPSKAVAEAWREGN